MCVLCIICVLYIICIYVYIWYCWCFRNLAAAPMSGEVVCPIVEDWFYRSQVVELVILTSPKFLEFWLRIWKKQSTMSFHSSLMPDHNFAQQKTHTHSQKPQIMWQTLGLGAWPWRGWKVEKSGCKMPCFLCATATSKVPCLSWWCGSEAVLGCDFPSNFGSWKSKNSEPGMQIICLAEAEGQRQLGMVRQLGSFFFTAVHIWQKWRCAFFCRFFFPMIEKGGTIFVA